MYAQSALIAEPDVAVWQELSPTLSTWLPDKRFDFCTTPHEALDRVADPAYDLVISSARLAESENFFLVKGLKCLSVPLVLTSGRSTVASSRRALEVGAFGLIRLPLDPKQAVQTILLATWVSDIFRRITAHRDSLTYYRVCLDGCPADPELEEIIERCDVVFETTYDTCKNTIMKIEKGVQHLARTAIALETEARLLAQAQLRELEVRRAWGTFK
jgi:CheY-like chemotaxis protein